MMEGKRSRGNYEEKMLDGLTKGLIVRRVTGALKAIRNQDVWNVMMA